MSDEKSKLVYSTDHVIPRKEKPGEKDFQVSAPRAKQRVVVRLDRKGRGGKSVTVIEGLLMPKKEKEALLKQLKTGFGTGGTITDSGLEIRGDLVDAVMEALMEIGCLPKRSGG
jgi:translation initiation factor 1